MTPPIAFAEQETCNSDGDFAYATPHDFSIESC